jgi:ATP-binding cassette, subfamily B, bacterial
MARVESIKTEHKAKLGDVLRAFWRGARFYKKTMVWSLLAWIIGNILDLVVPLYYKRFFDVIAAPGDPSLVAHVLVGIVFTILIINAIQWVIYRTGALSINYFEANTMARLRSQAFDYTIGHSYSFFSNTFTGALTQKIGRFARAFERLYDTLVFNLIPLLINIVGVIYVVWLEQPKIAVFILAWALVVISFSVVYSNWKLKYDLASAAADTKTGARLADAMTNHNTIASFAATDYESERFGEVIDEQYKATLKTWTLGELMNTFQNGFIVIIEFVVFYYGIKFWVAGKITIGTFVLIQVYILGLAQRLWGLNNIVRSVYESLADSKEMVDTLNLPHEVADVVGATDLNVSGGEILFKDVSFQFNDSRKILEDINLLIRPGEKVALIGPSGAGKSTIVKLLSRMHNLEQGVITIDGQDIQKVTQESLRESISLVPQDPILFHRSLMENIRYGRREATDAEVVEAAKLAHCDEFIDTLPDTYNTLVGERGIKLSGGERQRVAIARAILKNAPILILDEATSSLDSHSESLIQDALDKLMKGRTAIVIAHRLSTIRKMDRIVVVKEGKIEEEGSHEDLVKRDKSLYKMLWNLQAGGFIAE